MFIFPLIYLSSFLLSIRGFIKGNKQAILFFLIFGLPIYTTTLSVLFSMGWRDLIIYFQPFKELLILLAVGIGLWNFKRKMRYHMLDYFIGGYFLYTFLYVLLPIGEYGLFNRLLAFKSTSFFSLIYFAGRLFDLRAIYISKYFHYILLVAISATVVMLYELASDTHFQSLTGYSDYAYYFFGQEPSGNYGLTWTFERFESGHKRFSSFFSDPLEYASAMLLSVSVIGGLYTNRFNRFKPDRFGIIALIATLISVIFSISRSSMVSYFLIIYVYALITRKKYILQTTHTLLILISCYIAFLLSDRDVYDYIIDTITLQDLSGYGHLVEWLTGLNAIINNPFGLGLGSSGRVSDMTGSSTGGENQFIIIGVQAGVIALLLYLLIHISIIVQSFKSIKFLSGKERKIAISLFLFKVGSTLPLITSNLEAYPYINYISWFLAGLFVSVVANKAYWHKLEYSQVMGSK